jgi:hypothetical protein
MWSNHRALKMKNILIMYTSSVRHSMGLSKLLEHDMNVLWDFLTHNGFKIDKAESTLFTRKVDKDLFIYQIYVDDIKLVILINLFVISLVRS